MAIATQRCQKCGAIYPKSDQYRPSCAPEHKEKSVVNNITSDDAYTNTSWERIDKRFLFMILSPVLFVIPIAIFYAVFFFPFTNDNRPVVDFFVALTGPGARIVIALILISETAVFWRGGVQALRHAFKKGTPSLHVLVVKGEDKNVERQLATGAKIEARDQYGNTPLHIAAFKGNMPLVAALLKAGADMNARDKLGESALHKAAGGNHTTVVTALLAAGADKEARDKKGGTPLHQAAAGGAVGAMTALLDGGANKDAIITEHSVTPLHLAAVGGHGPAIKLLLRAGASKKIRTVQGKTARDLAEAKGHFGATVHLR